MNQLYQRKSKAKAKEKKRKVKESQARGKCEKKGKERKRKGKKGKKREQKENKGMENGNPEIKNGNPDYLGVPLLFRRLLKKGGGFIITRSTLVEHGILMHSALYGKSMKKQIKRPIPAVPWCPLLSDKSSTEHHSTIQLLGRFCHETLKHEPKI